MGNRRKTAAAMAVNIFSMGIPFVLFLQKDAKPEKVRLWDKFFDSSRKTRGHVSMLMASGSAHAQRSLQANNEYMRYMKSPSSLRASLSFLEQ
jgi:hypothetical protein